MVSQLFSRKWRRPKRLNWSRWWFKPIWVDGLCGRTVAFQKNGRHGAKCRLYWIKKRKLFQITKEEVCQYYAHFTHVQRWHCCLRRRDLAGLWLKAKRDTGWDFVVYTRQWIHFQCESIPFSWARSRCQAKASRSRSQNRQIYSALKSSNLQPLDLVFSWRISKAHVIPQRNLDQDRSNCNGSEF